MIRFRITANVTDDHRVVLTLPPEVPTGHAELVVTVAPQKNREPIGPDTDRAYTVEQMAQAFRAVGQPITEDHGARSFDPDEYPLF